MKIYTSYFGNMKRIPQNAVPIAICAKEPKWYQGLLYKQLAPKYGFFMKWKETHNNDEYTRCYYQQVLKDLSCKQVLKELETLSQGKDVVLLCYEKPEDFCHRHIVAEWMKQYEIDVQELKYQGGNTNV